MLDEIASLARLDFSPRHRQPPASRVLLATVAAIAGSLAADATLVAIGEAVFPGTKGYVHFRFSDYAKLTVIGVIIACAAWPIVTRVSSAPRWLFFRLAILVTLVLWLPDLYILHRGAPVGVDHAQPGQDPDTHPLLPSAGRAPPPGGHARQAARRGGSSRPCPATTKHRNGTAPRAW